MSYIGPIKKILVIPEPVVAPAITAPVKVAPVKEPVKVGVR